jgi:NADH-quinone oxidoreductase subunit N
MKPPLLPALPLIVIAAALIVGMIALSVRRNHRFIFYLALSGIVAAFASLLGLSRIVPQAGGLLFFADSFALFYGGLILAGGFATIILGRDYLKGRSESPEEFYLLMLGALLGGLALIGARHFVSFFLGLETLSISLYTLIGYHREQPVQTEGAIKYLVLSGVSSAFLLFGMAIIYGLSGTMGFDGLAGWMAGLAKKDPFLSLSGLVFVLIGIGFKLGVVPFHLWTPDVYESAPAPVTGFIATVSKGSVFALLLRFFAQTDFFGQPNLLAVFVVISVASMFVGNLLALFQRNVKRLLAYSSIAHFGYMLVAFLSTGPLRVAAVTYYLVAYFTTTIGAFGVVTLLSTKEKDAGSIDDYEGLFRRRPWLAGCFTVILLSLAGMPFTAGFVAKIYVVAAGTASLFWLPVLSLIVTSAIGLFYYLRLIFAMFGDTGREGRSVAALPFGGRVVMTLLFVLLVWWGVYPVHLIRVIELIRIGE